MAIIHPFGSFSEWTHEGESVAVRQVVAAILGQDGPGEAPPAPDGIGINCTGVRYLSAILTWNLVAQAWECIEADKDEVEKAWATTFVEIIRPCVGYKDGREAASSVSVASRDQAGSRSWRRL